MTSISPDILPKESKAEFEKNGVVCLRNVLSKEFVHLLRSDINAVMSHKSSTSYDFEELQKQAWASKDLQLKDKNESSDFGMYQLNLDKDIVVRPITDKVDDNSASKFFYDSGMWRFFDGIKFTALKSPLPKISAQLLDIQYINFWEDTIVVNPSQTSHRKTFHKGWASFQIIGEKCCIIWIPLDTITKANGAMEYICGSHLWDKTNTTNLAISQPIDPTSPYEKRTNIEENCEKHDIISFDVKPGDVIIHHAKTVKGSRGNISSNAIQRAVAFGYCGDDIRYFDKLGAVDQPYSVNKLKNGDRLVSPDYPIAYGKIPATKD